MELGADALQLSEFELGHGSMWLLPILLQPDSFE